MPEFTELDIQEKNLLRIFTGYKKFRTEFILNKIAAKSAIRLADAVASSLDITKKSDLQLLATLSVQKSRAYERLGDYDGAIRFTSLMIKRAWRKLGFGGE